MHNYIFEQIRLSSVPLLDIISAFAHTLTITTSYLGNLFSPFTWIIIIFLQFFAIPLIIIIFACYAIDRSKKIRRMAEYNAFVLGIISPYLWEGADVSFSMSLIIGSFFIGFMYSLGVRSMFTQRDFANL